MDSNDVVSIFFPVKNTAPYLKVCIQSIINQTYTQWELLAVENHSSDNSLEILRYFESQDKRIKVYQNPNKSLVSALNLAFSKSKGNLVCRMDSDDIMAENRLSLMVSKLKSNRNNCIVIGQVSYFSDAELGEGYKKYESWLNNVVLAENFSEEIFKECVVPSPNWMMSKVDFEKVGGYHENYPEDYDFCFRLYLNKIKMLGIPEVTHYWRDRADRVSRTEEIYKDPNFLEIKVDYFIKTQLKNKHDDVVVWGAGKKGKKVVKLFQDHSIKSHWVAEATNKIGADIYGIIVENPSVLKSKIENKKVVVCVSNPAEQLLVCKQLQDWGYGLGVDYFVFC